MNAKRMMPTQKPACLDKEAIREALPFTRLMAHYGFEVLANEQVRCPFHGEDHRPSATVKGGFFHCFVCNESLDLFAFIMKMESCNFQEAVTIGAERAGVKATESPRKLANVISERQHYSAEKKRLAAASNAKYQVLECVALKVRPLNPDWMPQLETLLDAWTSHVPEWADMRPLAFVYANGGDLDALKVPVIRLFKEKDACHE